MRIIIAPAKKMIVDTDSFAVDGLPQFPERTEQLKAVLQTMSPRSCGAHLLYYIGFKSFEILPHLPSFFSLFKMLSSAGQKAYWSISSTVIHRMSLCSGSLGGKNASVFPGNVPDAPVICLNTYSNEGQQVFQAAQAAGCPLFTLVTIDKLDWNRDMAPWDSPAAFKNGEP